MTSTKKLPNVSLTEALNVDEPDERDIERSDHGCKAALGGGPSKVCWPRWPRRGTDTMGTCLISYQSNTDEMPLVSGDELDDMIESWKKILTERCQAALSSSLRTSPDCDADEELEELE